MEKIDENSKNNIHTCNSIFTQPLKSWVNKNIRTLITVLTVSIILKLYQDITLADLC